MIPMRQIMRQMEELDIREEDIVNIYYRGTVALSWATFCELFAGEPAECDTTRGSEHWRLRREGLTFVSCRDIPRAEPKEVSVPNS